MHRPIQRIDRLSSPSTKIALFRSLFRGRDDVYARRFENPKTGKSGYAPACGNEWAPGVCEKPRIKCAACPHQRFLAVTDEAVRWHLAGRDDLGHDFVMGLYPLLRDETCFFLAIDLDKKSWRDDGRALLDTCRGLDLPAVLERSRSGNGAHLWLFFGEAVPASLARKLGSCILTETMDRQPGIGLDSYDRLFPNQDTLPQGGFGNLIALPLQKAPRELGNSVFLDDAFEPHRDQWALLSAMHRIERAAAETIVSRAERKGRIIGVRLAPEEDDDLRPWEAPPPRRRKELACVGPLPGQIELILGNQIYIAKDQMTPGLQNRLVRMAAFQNPEFYKAQAMRLSTYGKPRVVACAEDFPQHLGLPRGCLDEAQAFLTELGIRVTVRDERRQGEPLAVAFQGQLHPEQAAAAEAMLAHDTGVLAATTAFGKTVVAAWLIARRAVNTLVLVHRRQLMEQWVQRLATFLDLPKMVGQIGGGRNKPTGLLDVALIQSLSRKGIDLVGDYGHLVVDECHHLSAASFERVVRQAKARFVTGLSATVARKDGHHPIIFMQCGPVRHRVDAKGQAAARPFAHTVHVRPTGFRPSGDASDDPRVRFQELYSELVADRDRNEFVCDEVLAAIGEGRSPLVLTERNEHLDVLAERLASRVQHLVMLRGGMGRKELGAALTRLSSIPEHEQRVLLATGRYVGEGFDDARLDTLFLTLPVSWRGTIAQYVGRLHRLHHRKREVRVYDYADLNVPMLARMFDRRCRGYEVVGYSILLPASAVPGWPPEVALPLDPQWKSDYAASVQRLIRDGVDAPLANLFSHAARTISLDAEGVDRARSASEAFLYRRLQSLPLTAGKFRLNAELPISFDGNGRMEVDLLCAEARLAVELDGAQHLDSPTPIAATAARTCCSSSRAISCCDSWPRMSASVSTPCSTQSSVLCPVEKQLVNEIQLLVGRCQMPDSGSKLSADGTADFEASPGRRGRQYRANSGFLAPTPTYAPDVAIQCSYVHGNISPLPRASSTGFQHRAPAPRHLLEGAGVGLLQRHHDAAVWLKKQRHVRKRITDGQRLDGGVCDQIALVRYQRQRLAVRQLIRTVFQLTPNGCMNSRRISWAGRKRIDDQQMHAALQ